MATSRSTPPADVIRPEFPESGPRRERGPVGPGHRWTLWDALKVLSLRNLVFAVLLGVLGGAAGAVIALRQTPQYSSHAVLLIDQPALISEAKDEGLIRKLSLLRLKYAALVQTPGIAGIAAEQLGVPEPQVAAAVAASAPPDSLALVTTGVGRTPTTAIRLANSIAAAVVTYTDEEQLRYSVPANARYQFSVVAPASEAAKTQPQRKRAVQAAFGLGAILLAAAYVILQLLTFERRLT
jgi:capsular polysaccharide biosynthesis protein